MRIMKHQMWHRHYLQPNPNGSYRNLTVPFKHTYKISSLLKKKGRLAASIKLLYMLKYWFDNPHVLPGCLSIARHTQKPFSSGVWLGTKAPANLTPCMISLRDSQRPLDQVVKANRRRAEFDSPRGPIFGVVE